jgi:hypothetical protein
VDTKKNDGRKRFEWAKVGVLVVAGLLLLRGLNLPEEMPYLGWIAFVLAIGMLFVIAYDSSKRW